MTGWAIDIDRDDIRQARVVDDPAAPLSPGTIRVAHELFSLTANNVTYAYAGKPMGLFGNDQGYWDFFSERDAPGRLPIWGFATVTDSACDGIAVGDRFYGYYPMASHSVLRPGKIGPNGFTDVTRRRTTLPPVYNNYQRIESFPEYRAEHHELWPIHRPLYLTGWMIADQFEEENDYGVQQILVASASSKTAIGFVHAFGLQDRARPQTIGLTSAGNVAALAAKGLYDRVIAYDDIAALDPSVPSALVDMAGNAAVTSAVHRHFGDQVKASIVVGKSHWDASGDAGHLPGAPRQGFFAPGRVVKRLGDWGPAEFGQRLGAAWLAFMDVAPDLARVDKRSGAEAALGAYHELVAGKADPTAGIVIQP